MQIPRSTWMTNIAYRIKLKSNTGYDVTCYFITNKKKMLICSLFETYFEANYQATVG